MSVITHSWGGKSWIPSFQMSRWATRRIVMAASWIAGVLNKKWAEKVRGTNAMEGFMDFRSKRRNWCLLALAGNESLKPHSRAQLLKDGCWGWGRFIEALPKEFSLVSILEKGTDATYCQYFKGSIYLILNVWQFLDKGTYLSACVIYIIHVYAYTYVTYSHLFTERKGTLPTLLKSNHIKTEAVSR